MPVLTHGPGRMSQATIGQSFFFIYFNSLQKKVDSATFDLCRAVRTWLLLIPPSSFTLDSWFHSQGFLRPQDNSVTFGRPEVKPSLRRWNLSFSLTKWRKWEKLHRITGRARWCIRVVTQWCGDVGYQKMKTKGKECGVSDFEKHSIIGHTWIPTVPHVTVGFIESFKCGKGSGYPRLAGRQANRDLHLHLPFPLPWEMPS